VSGTYANEQTLSAGGQDAFNPQADAGANVDANAAIVWTRSDGTNLRVQAARRRDVVGFPRPKGASPTRVSLVPAYNACSVPNRTHGPGLVFPSCNPPVMNSSVLTVGTADSYPGTVSNSVASIRFRAVNGNAATEANEADVDLLTQISDVRNNPALTDYAGSLMASVSIKLTDNQNSEEQPEPGTVQAYTLNWSIPCATTTDTTKGSDCNSTTTVNALVPGSVVEIKRTLWELGQVLVKDAGPNGTGVSACPPTCGDGDETTFMRQGIFVP
jgi:hypothetical protein